jgi:adenylate cyclase
MKLALLIDPDDWNLRYNFACVLLIHMNESDAALDLLGPVLESEAASYYLGHIRVDPDFTRVRDNQRFKAMMAAAASRVAPPADAGRDRSGENTVT